jgi:ribosomal protein L13
MVKDPRKIIEHAVAGMLPDNRLKDKRMRRLKVFSDDKHDYADKFTKAK